MDSNGNLVQEEKSFAEKLVGRIVSAILQQFGIQWNPVGMFASAMKKSANDINNEIKTNAQNFGGNYALGFIMLFSLI